MDNYKELEKKHKEFIAEVCQSEVVYSLEFEEQYASSTSVEYEDEDQNPIDLICFWSNRKLAEKCIQNDWKKHKISEIRLSEFMEDWCVGMHNDGLLVGTQFDAEMEGFESEPETLLMDLIAELKSQEKDLNFSEYEGIEDLEDQLKNIED